MAGELRGSQPEPTGCGHPEYGLRYHILTIFESIVNPTIQKPAYNYCAFVLGNVFTERRNTNVFTCARLEVHTPAKQFSTILIFAKSLRRIFF